MKKKYAPIRLLPQRAADAMHGALFSAAFSLRQAGRVEQGGTNLNALF